MVRFIHTDYNVGKLYGIQIGRHKFTSYITKAKNPNRSKDLQISYSRQRSENVYEVVYTKSIQL